MVGIQAFFVLYSENGGDILYVSEIEYRLIFFPPKSTKHQPICKEESPMCIYLIQSQLLRSSIDKRCK